MSSQTLLVSGFSVLGVFDSINSSLLFQYYANNLGAEQHNLVLAPHPQQTTGQFLDLDFITIYTASEEDIGNSTTTPSGFVAFSSVVASS